MEGGVHGGGLGLRKLKSSLLGLSCFMVLLLWSLVRVPSKADVQNLLQAYINLW